MIKQESSPFNVHGEKLFGVQKRLATKYRTVFYRTDKIDGFAMNLNVPSDLNALQVMVLVRPNIQ
jgi:hypothetical protein